MATARRSPTRPGAGPGRGTRTRTGAQRKQAQSARANARPQQLRDPADDLVDEAPEPRSAAESRRREAVRRRSSLTTRAIALAVVLLVLTISYASSLRIYLSQRHEIAATKAEIALRQDQIAELQSTLTRWDDPAYVKTQARARLGWVVPGETGYRVIGPDGNPVGTQAVGGSSAATVSSPPKAWWQGLMSSVKAADADPVAQPTPTKQPTITESSKPKG